ncbi:peptidoglycan-binding domain-containing protein [Streptomyces millisiae]|uniref:Peptidoglycan-binding domain-containing protein n=1 Tax=Streptomyces millisiae TaxID=3075542 RepID=A0ABU2LXH0_9ACTN|nr:peptidoglycan-binding domain-containing protein [Streptomyces sp. DSM 44918]MDT0322292.1 peptidoglycan-binding domain-containing protein [Streptomyces sp. DSM 44918]
MRTMRKLAVSTAVTTALVTGATVLAAAPASATPDRGAVSADSIEASAWYCGYDNRTTPPTIAYGSSGNTVREAQCLLNTFGYGLAVDGQFGPATRSAVRNFQSRFGLAVDGIVGPNTWYGLRNY